MHQLLIVPRFEIKLNHGGTVTLSYTGIISGLSVTQCVSVVKKAN